MTDTEARVWFQYVLSADDFGVMRLSALTIQSANDALAKHDTETIQVCLQRLVQVELVVPFEHQGRRFICQLDWQDYQKVRHPRDTYQPCPFPEILQKCSRDTLALFRDFHRSFPKTDPSLARVRARETANGKRLTANGSEEKELLARFDRFWAVYPRKVGKDAALREWQHLAPDNDLSNQIIAAVSRQQQSPQWRKDGGEFIPHPRTWLHQKRWTDEIAVATSSGAPRPREEHQEPWASLAKDLKTRINRQSFYQFFGKSRQSSFDEDSLRLVIAVPTSAEAAWIETNYRDAVNASIKAVNKFMSVEFVSDGVAA